MNRHQTQPPLNRTIAGQASRRMSISSVVEPLEPRQFFSATACAVVPAPMDNRVGTDHEPVAFVEAQMMVSPPQAVHAILRAGPGGFVGILNRNSAPPESANDADSEEASAGTNANSTQGTAPSRTPPDDGRVVVVRIGGHDWPVALIGIGRNRGAALAEAPASGRPVVKDRPAAEIVLTRSSEVAAAESEGPLTPLSQNPAPISINLPTAAQGLQGRPSFRLGDISVVPSRIDAPGSLARPGSPQDRLALAAAWSTSQVFYSNGSVGGHAEVGIATAAAHVTSKSIDALATIGSTPILAGEVMYNFVHFNPSALLDDAIAGFVNESAAISVANPFSSAPNPSHRAWTVSAAVVGIDLIIMSCLYQRAKTDRAMKAKLTGSWGVEIDPCQPRLL
jgi:hypothetical protein